MKRETIAAIDIGSNAIRLLINYVERNGSVEFKKAAFVRVPIRLGEDVFTKGFIEKDKVERMTDAMKSFYFLIKTFNVSTYRACATSAMREAANNNEIVNYIKEQSGINIEIISGKEEAETIFEAGDFSAFMNKNKNYVYVDVGGGSTEITIYSNNKRLESQSFPLGTVRMLSNAVDKEEEDKFKKWLKKRVLPYNAIGIIGSGGNINKIHKILGKREGEPITYVELKVLYEQLKNMSYEERIKQLGLNTYRADVIIPAMKIFINVCKACKINEIIVPKVGLADGIIHHLYNNMSSNANLIKD